MDVNSRSSTTTYFYPSFFRLLFLLDVIHLRSLVCAGRKYEYVTDRRTDIVVERETTDVASES
jgi:hypothetical protein